MHRNKLGRYDLVRVLGKGAMGVVYEGRDPNLDRAVAIKTIMVDGLTGDAASEYEARFRTEARSAGRLQHPNIVTVYDSDRDGDTAFLVMEYVHGEDLKQHLESGKRCTVPEALHLVHDLLAALEFAHGQGIIHRDIKPANLLVEPTGRLKLTDFGVARIAGEATRTQGSMIGTLKYMAPEQVQGQKVDARADLYSAGVVAYQLLTGVRPIDGDNDFSIIHQVLSQMPAAPSTVAPGLPAALDGVMARALAKEPQERYGCAAELWQALREAFPGVDLPAMAPSQRASAPAPAAPLPPAAQPIAAPAQPAVARSPTIPGGPIGHEFELEYWRDVRDSTDSRELEGFLARFPEGIYADLARRRLQRLAGPDDPDQTVLRGMTRVPVAAPVAAAGLAGDTPPSAVSQEASAAGPAPVRAADSGPAPAQGSAPQDQSSAGAIPARTDRKPADAAAVRKPAGTLRKAVLAGLAIVAVVAAAVAVRGERDPPAPAVGSDPAVASPVAAGVPASPATAASAPASAATAVRAETPRVAARPAPAPARRTNAASTPAAGATVPTAAPSAPPAAPLQQARAESASPQPAQARGERLVPPSVTCKDKVFLARQFCLQQECSKPGYENFPACIKLKEEARLREESRVRN